VEKSLKGVTFKTFMEGIVAHDRFCGLVVRVPGYATEMY
jgi:hypothetical protein